jgi:ribosomal protein S18 acetylase RimI-like enzyme
MSVEIRPLSSADAEAFQSLRLEALRNDPSSFASSYEEECDTPLATVAERLTSVPERCVLGAFDAGRLVGMVGIEKETMRKLAHKAWIWGMYVTPAARQRGIGRQLMSEVLRYARDTLQVERVNLGVNAANAAAVALYRALDFETYGLERAFLKVDGELHDEFIMVRVLPNA